MPALAVDQVRRQVNVIPATGRNEAIAALAATKTRSTDTARPHQRSH